MTNEEAKTFLDNLKVCVEEHPIVADWLVEIADRKTENSSEIPNNFDKDINVRSKDEPKLSEIPTSKCHYEPKDEPQTERSNDAE